VGRWVAYSGSTRNGQGRAMALLKNAWPYLRYYNKLIFNFLKPFLIIVSLPLALPRKKSWAAATGSL